MKKVKWGVIGAGGIADRRTIPGMMLAKNAELVAVMEVNPDVAEALRAKYNAKYAYTDAFELIANPEVEVVYIASPVTFHKDQVIAAAKAGKHILCEKPIAMTVEEAEEIQKICDDCGVKTATGFMMRYHAYHKKMHDLIAEGVLGQVVSARAQLTCWYPKMEGAWRQKKALSGGGALIDMGVHCIDLIEYITGGRTVKTMAFNATKTFDYDVDDSSNVLIQLDNGVTGYVDSNFNIPDAAAKCRMEFYGTRGSIIAEGTIGQVEGGKIEVVVSDAEGYDANQNRNDVAPMEINVEFGNMYTKEIESFSDSVLNDTPIEIPMSDAVHIQKVVRAAYESSDKGICVEVK
ncbi:MAG: Gfo/Idh/MocA family oxidoreductase [Oscillospiraceae bacterium]|nr:Gfo/Idh/MocA family oxidoreductase [Oscillospiraceae bacterium]